MTVHRTSKPCDCAAVWNWWELIGNYYWQLSVNLGLKVIKVGMSMPKLRLKLWLIRAAIIEWTGNYFRYIAQSRWEVDKKTIRRFFKLKRNKNATKIFALFETSSVSLIWRYLSLLNMLMVTGFGLYLNSFFDIVFPLFCSRTSFAYIWA